MGSWLRARPCPAGGARAGACATWPPRVHADPPLTSLGSLYVSLGWGQGTGLAASSRLCPEGLQGWGGAWARAGPWALSQCSPAGEPGASPWLCCVAGTSEHLPQGLPRVGLKPAPSGEPRAASRVPRVCGRLAGRGILGAKSGPGPWGVCAAGLGSGRAGSRPPRLLLQRGADTWTFCFVLRFRSLPAVGRGMGLVPVETGLGILSCLVLLSVSVFCSEITSDL